MRTAVGWVAGKTKVEASGGITLENVRAIAETGVDYISVGAITHSARSVDLALDFEL
jgi:nicotinate-nucleotide pyrophosphorylase (carboxylating)